MGQNESSNKKKRPRNMPKGKVDKEKLDKIKQELIKGINKLRVLHQVSELKPSGDIDSIAQSFANKIAKKGELDYSLSKYKGEDLGENLFSCGSYECTAETIIESWTKDKNKFEYNMPNAEATPFAQLVWKSSKLIGIGISEDGNGETYVVANFFPAGSVMGKFAENVFPPDHSQEELEAEEGNNPNGRRRSIRKKEGKQDLLGFSEFCREALEHHNTYRNKHHSPALNLNRELCKIAQDYAEKLSSGKAFNHSNGKYDGKDMGENLFTCSGREATGKMATDDWYNESKSYNYKKDYQKGTLDFTQLIWKGTTDVGFGVSNKGDSYYVVANYFPPGNFLGKFCENVKKP